MKTYKTAKAILRNALLDIEAGYWCQGDLCKATDGDFFSTPRTLKEKPLGCALGLIAMYGGETKSEMLYLGSRATSNMLMFDMPRYPHSGSSKGVRDAVNAVYDAIPKSTRKRLHAEVIGDVHNSSIYPPDGDGTPVEFEVRVSCVYMYNDEKTTNRKKAARWFAKALKETS